MTTTINASTSAGLVNTADTSGVLQLQTAGTTAVTVDASQNVGIGTASPASFGSPLSVYSATNPTLAIVSGNANVYLRLFSTSDNNMYLTNTGGAMTMNTANTERMRIDSSGNVGVGTTSPSNKLDVFRSTFGGSNTSLILSSVNSVSAKINFAGIGYTVDQGSAGIESGSMYFSTYGSGALTERARIDSSGNLLVGVTSAFNSGKQCLAFSGATHQGFNIRNNADNPSDIYVGFYNAYGTNTGAIRSGGSTTSYVTSSDYRLKENVQPLVNALDKVMALNPVSYTWKTGGEDNGFIAHELQLILPNAVSGEKDAVNEDGTINPQGVDYSRLTPILTAALQEAIAEIQLLKTRVAKLEAK